MNINITHSSESNLDELAWRGAIVLGKVFFFPFLERQNEEKKNVEIGKGPRVIKSCKMHVNWLGLCLLLC
jgi:hypothetical protein